MSDWWADRPPAGDREDEPGEREQGPAGDPVDATSDTVGGRDEHALGDVLPSTQRPDDATSAVAASPDDESGPGVPAMPARDATQGWSLEQGAEPATSLGAEPPGPPSSPGGSADAARTAGDHLPELPVHPPVPHVPHAPAPPSRRHSRNPVDRLTRGLPDPVRIVVDWVVTIAGAIAIVLLVKAFVVNPYRIPSSSMESTLHCAQPASGCEARFSDRVLANRFLYHLRDPRRGEIVVFETPPQAQVKCGAGGTFVKRLIGMPGETIEVRLEGGDGYVYVNGRKLSEPYVEKERRGAVEEFGPVKVPEGAYFMMGDNRAQSCDSRVWGSVPRENLIGKVFATYWPPNRLSLH